MNDRPSETTADLIVEYIRRGRASTINVASHFAMFTPTARSELMRLEAAGVIRRIGKSVRESWEIITND